MRLSVRVALTPPFALLAQPVEQRSFKPQVGSSSLPGRTKYVVCSSVGRAPGCGPGGRRFESAHTPHGALAQLVERQTEDLRVSGSIPEGPTISLFWSREHTAPQHTDLQPCDW